jgi:hypothetical protein
MPQILSFIEKLLNEGLAYTTEDGSVYFNLKTYSDKNFLYGKLKPPDSLKSSDGGKKFSIDFALWKASKSSSEPSWKPSWGKNGRPGWHVSIVLLLFTNLAVSQFYYFIYSLSSFSCIYTQIECSAMARLTIIYNMSSCCILILILN